MSEKKGFNLPERISFDDEQNELPRKPIRSEFSNLEALESAQLIQLSDGEGSILFYPKRVRLEVGDVLFLRERPDEGEEENGEESSTEPEDETGVIIQIISLGTATYPQADTKALFRLMVNVRASTLERSHNEPKEIIDEFLLASFKVRAEVKDGEWVPPEGHVVTRNVDIFWLDPTILCDQILERIDGLNIHLGKYKTEPISFFGGGFEKINLITGMKGGGKSHIAKGIISESLKAGMSAIVFDINNEYRHLPDSYRYVPGQNLRFRLDRIQGKTLINMIDLLAPFAERTALPARAGLHRVIRARSEEGVYPDLKYLRDQAPNIIKGDDKYILTMQNSFKQSLDIVETYGLLMNADEASEETQFLSGELDSPPDIVSLSSVLHNIEYGGKNEAGVVIFDIGGMMPVLQYVIVDLIIDTLKEICRRQTVAYKKGKREIPNYPTIYFEEAHMYMKSGVIDELLPLIRHHGMNVFFITNTPGALPDSVFRLMDNLLMTRMLNKRDIDQVKNCGLTDQETIEGFARNLKTHHSLLLSGLKGATSNFPLAFHVRDFDLPESGETRSMWKAMQKNAELPPNDT